MREREVDAVIGAAISRTSRHRSSPASSCASSVSDCRSFRPAARRSVFRERSAGAISCSSSAASRSAAVRNVRRCRAVDAEARQLGADRGDVGVGLGVALVGARCRRRQQAVVLELLRRAPA